MVRPGSLIALCPAIAGLLGAAAVTFAGGMGGVAIAAAVTVLVGAWMLSLLASAAHRGDLAALRRSIEAAAAGAGAALLEERRIDGLDRLCERVLPIWTDRKSVV